VTARTDFHPFVYEHGRRYQTYREWVYMLPNDLPEIERLDHYHRSFVDLLDGKLYIAPLGKDGHQMKNVLDIGTGTGTWANEMAEWVSPMMYWIGLGENGC
jgi:ubiquinone/menaquinone biosynthesis C-methylase UbiE